MMLKRVHKKKEHANRTPAQSITALTKYILSPENRRNSCEKCIMAGSYNFTTDTLAQNMYEMIATASDPLLNEQIRQPMQHYILSFSEADKITYPDGTLNKARIKAALDTVLRELGVLQQHQVIYGLHGDTDNYHLHIEINRVNPATYICKELSYHGDYGIVCERIHAVLADELGMALNPHDRFEIRHINGKKVLTERQAYWDRQNRRKTGQEPPKIKPHAIEREINTGQASAIRLAQKYALDVMLTNASWADLHRNLAKVGCRYVMEYRHQDDPNRPTGSKLMVNIDGTEIPIKCSSVNAKVSYTKMLARLGDYEPPRGDLAIIPLKGEILLPPVDEADRYNHTPITDYRHNYQERPITRDKSLYDAYYAAYNAWRDGKRDARAEMMAAQKANRDEFYERQKAARAEFKAQKIAKDLRRQKRSEFNDYWLRQKQAMQEANQQIQLIYRQSYVLYRYPNFKEWERTPSLISTDYEYVQPTGHGINDYSADFQRDKTIYRDIADNKIAFIDRGRQLDFSKIDLKAIKTGLQLAKMKWPHGITIKGNKAYIETCIKIAASDPNIIIDNPELQDRIAAARAAYQAAHAPRPAVATQQTATPQVAQTQAQTASQTQPQPKPQPKPIPQTLTVEMGREIGDYGYGEKEVVKTIIISQRKSPTEADIRAYLDMAQKDHVTSLKVLHLDDDYKQLAKDIAVKDYGYKTIQTAQLKDHAEAHKEHAIKRQRNMTR